MLNEFILSFDLDWAPDFVIDAVSETLLKRKIKSTWFVTHDSPAVRRLFEHERVHEIGIHPNFLSNSTHGKNEREIMNKITKLFPKSKIIRTHALFQSTLLLKNFVKDYGIKIDVSLFLPETSNLQPHTIHFDHNKELIRVPFFWEDDIEMNNPSKSWKIKHPKYHVAGLKIFNLHPIHIFLNSSNPKGYQNLKLQKPIYSLQENEVRSQINKDKPGVKDLFNELCDFISTEQKYSYTISEIVEKWKEEKSENRD